MVQPLSVGEVAARLGVAPSTVRMWGRRYGLTASDRSPGGHRRYTADDLERLQRMSRSVTRGATPAAAADVATADAGAPRARPDADDRTRTRSGPRRAPGGSVLALPGAGPAARGLARAATRLDEIGVEDAVVEALHEQGTLTAWDELLRPVLVSAGEHWQQTGTGIEIELVLTQAVTSAFVRHVAGLPDVAQESPVLLAGGPQEEHVLALHAVRAALTERAVPARLIGPRTPASALAAAARRTRACAVLIWLSLPDAAAAHGLPTIHGSHRTITVAVGGPGWQDVDDGRTVRCDTLQGAVDLLHGAWTAQRGRRAATR